jgi:hypothetical protein
VHPRLARHVLRLGVERDDEVGLHACVLLGASGAWLVVGARHAGKSTLALACHQAGILVLSDDVAILRGGDVFSGPRCVDLRTPAEGSVPARGDRHRVTLPPAPAQVPLAGVLHLEWGPAGAAPAVRALSAGEHLARLADPTRGDAVPAQAVGLLDVASSAPGYVLSRSRDGAVREAAHTAGELLGA